VIATANYVAIVIHDFIHDVPQHALSRDNAFDKTVDAKVGEIAAKKDEKRPLVFGIIKTIRRHVFHVLISFNSTHLIPCRRSNPFKIQRSERIGFTRGSGRSANTNVLLKKG
jgi:hypothetical protein